MSARTREFWLVLRWLFYAVILLVAIAVMLPNFVPSRWTSSGLPVTLKIAVADAQTGEAIPGAKVQAWLHIDWRFAINEASVGFISATTDATGNCEVHSYFPGSGSGDKGRLRVNNTISIRADGYEHWERPGAALLGSHLTVSNALQTNSFALKIMLNRMVDTTRGDK